MTDADNVMNPHFGSDPADIRIRIRINPKIWIRIPDHFWLRLDALVEVCALEHSLVVTTIETAWIHRRSTNTLLFGKNHFH